MDTSKKTILHVDDELLWRQFVRELLGRRHEIISCRDLMMALVTVQRGAVDLALVDHLIPGSGPFTHGLDFCLHLRKTFPNLPVIIYTGAWRGVSGVDRKELQNKLDVTVVFKDARDHVLDDLQGKIESELACSVAHA